jgi:GTP-binding protein EngB required for normal cell division
MEIMKRADQERMNCKLQRVKYIVVLTKVDKASREMVATTRLAVQKACSDKIDSEIIISNEKDKNDDDGVTMEIIETSVTEKIGRESLWKIILKTLESKT